MQNPRAKKANITLKNLLGRLGRLDQSFKTAARLARYVSHRFARLRGVIEALQGIPTSVGTAMVVRRDHDLLVMTAA